MKAELDLSKISIGRIFILLITAVTILLIFHWYTNIKWIDKEINEGWKPKANKNRYLAAEYFLHKAGIESQVMRGFKLIEKLDADDSLIKSDDTIVLVNGYGALTEKQSKLLTDWVSNGGVLVASSENIYHSRRFNNDKLLEHYGISADTNSKFKNEEDEKEEVKENKQMGGDDTTEVVEVEESDSLPPNHISIFEDEDSIVVPGWGPPFLFDEESEPYGWRSSKRGVELVYLDVGDSGYFCASSGNSMWDNININTYNNAYLLWLLSNSSDKVWFLLNEKTQPLLSRIWEFSPAAVLLLICSIVLSYWYKLRRIGPVLSVDYRTDRRFLEHLQSSGELLWRAGQGSFLLERLRRDALQRINLKYPLLNNLDSRTKLDRLSEYLKLPIDTVQYIFFTKQVVTERHFLEHIQNLQKIREAL